MKRFALDDDGPWVVQVNYGTQARLNLIARRAPPWEVDKLARTAAFEVANRFELQQWRALGFKPSVDLERTALIRKPRQPLAKAAKSIPGFACYRTVEETFATIDALVAEAPNLASIVDIGDSQEKVRNAANGYDLRVLKLTNAARPGPKPKLFAMSSVHAREYTPAELMTRFAEQVVRGYGVDADFTAALDSLELHFLLQANPDGRKQAESALSWRKNTNAAYCGPNSNGRGADLNRNFPYLWGAFNGSSTQQCDLTYRGPAAASEPETQAIINYVRTLFPDRRGPGLLDPAPIDTAGLFFDFHAFSQLVLWPYGFDADPAAPGNQGSANDVALRTLGRRFAWFNNYVPQAAVELYVTDGTTLDFAYGELGVAAYTFELGTAFFEPCATFEATVLPDNLRALRYALKVAAEPYRLPAGPEAREVGEMLIESGESAAVVATLDDRAFSATNGLEAAQSIASAGVYLTQPSGQSAPLATLTALDGALDSPLERVVGAWAPDRPVGRYLLYVQGTDSAGSVGPVGASWLTVAAPKTTGRWVGVVRDARNARPLPGALVVSERNGALSGNDGRYSLRVLPGLRTVQASRAGYAGLSAAAVSVTAGAAVTQNLDLKPICPAFRDNLDGDITGWTAQAPWGRTLDRSVSPPFALTDSPAGNYANNANTVLTSPPISTLGFSEVRLGFQSFCATQLNADFGRVELSIDNGASFSEIWRCSGEPLWKRIELNLPTAAERAAIRVRFRLTSNGSQTAEGWTIDDVSFSGGSLACPFTDDMIFADGFNG
jgi:carboxypeptidase T